MKKITGFIILAIGLFVSACGPKDTPSAEEEQTVINNDKMVYGLACDGSTDSVVVFMPFTMGDSLAYSDPLTFNIINAYRKKQIFGHPEIGDWIGVLISEKNPREATMVIDLDQLKGTWTYQVLPTLKQMATKTEAQIEAEITDSMREELFIPREYGFTLKRHRQASSVGWVYKGNDLEDESPVEYPPVPIYTGWKTTNGKLILQKDTLDENRQRLPDHKIKRDTAEFVFMLQDSLVLRFPQQTISFHRKQNAMEANKQANQQAMKKAAQDSIR